MNKVILAIVHGVEFGDISQNYAKPLLENIESFLTDKEKNDVIPFAYNYGNKSNARQMSVFEATDKGLKNEKLRLLKHKLGSDITWSLIRAKGNGECFFTDFVKDFTQELKRKLYLFDKAKVVCVGHSQGSALLFTMFFDYLGQIEGFVSLGSPISMNSGAWPDFGRIPPNLGWWINFYNQMDFISSRIEGVHPSEKIALFVKDYEVKLPWYNPIYHLPKKIFKMQLLAGFHAHVIYWKSKFVAKIIAEKLKELLA